MERTHASAQVVDVETERAGSRRNVTSRWVYSCPLQDECAITNHPQEIMDILRVKKAQPPPVVPAVKRRVTSAAIVPADAQASDVAIEDAVPDGGSFNSLHDPELPGGVQSDPRFIAAVQSEPSNGAAADGPVGSIASHSEHESDSDSDGSDSD